ncbi:hypothetical protein V6N12_067789 [Hibiscus sabdariffa]|uniref:Uncharacterized protein n=1 Tax=Hibiscus sabdariffa TaxID=183260 RepID=A0ABR2FN63_9ROSI
MARTNVGFHPGSTHRPTIGLTIYTQLGSLGWVSSDPKNTAQTLAHSAKRLASTQPTRITNEKHGEHGDTKGVRTKAEGLVVKLSNDGIKWG